MPRVNGMGKVSISHAQDIYIRLGMICAAAYLVLGLSCQACSSQPDIEPSRIVGGPCEYKDYAGKAEILSIRRIQRDHGAEINRTTGEFYSITYRFMPVLKIQESFVNAESSELIMLRSDSTYPDLEYIERNDIRVGKKFDCILKVITKGACTPLIGIFPTLQ